VFKLEELILWIEVNTNGENVETARGYLNGPDTGGTRLWWDIEGSNF